MDIIAGAIGALLLAQFIDGRVALALAVAFVVGRRMFLRNRRLADIKKLGLPSEDMRVVSELLRKGDQAGAIARIAAVQGRHREEMLSKGVDVTAMTPEVGREIEWTDIVRHVFRILDFDRAGTTVDASGAVNAASATAPYGYLFVESPIMNQPVRLPIVHQDDFLLAASVFDEPELAEAAKSDELLVTYIPKDKLPGGLAGLSHALHYVLTPHGTLEKYYSVNADQHMAQPAPEKLFGPFVWEGEIRVGVNRNPSV